MRRIIRNGRVENEVIIERKQGARGEEMGLIFLDSVRGFAKGVG